MSRLCSRRALLTAAAMARSAARNGVLVDHRRGRTVVAHPCHEVAHAGAGARGERVPNVPQVVEVQSGHAHCGNGLLPAQKLV